MVSLNKRVSRRPYCELMKQDLKKLRNKQIVIQNIMYVLGIVFWWCLQTRNVKEPLVGLFYA